MLLDMFSVSTSPQTGFLTPYMYLLSDTVATSYYKGAIYKPKITKVEISQFRIFPEGGYGFIM